MFSIYPYSLYQNEVNTNKNETYPLNLGYPYLNTFKDLSMYTGASQQCFNQISQFQRQDNFYPARFKNPLMQKTKFNSVNKIFKVASKDKCLEDFSYLSISTNGNSSKNSKRFSDDSFHFEVSNDTTSSLDQENKN
jgi:hypothetical protein